MVFSGHPQMWMAENTWFGCFGDVVTFFDEIVPLHFTNWSWCVKRVLYSDLRDVDFSILPFDHLDEVPAKPGLHRPAHLARLEHRDVARGSRRPRGEAALNFFLSRGKP